jgi:hypothetical protein
MFSLLCKTSVTMATSRILSLAFVLLVVSVTGAFAQNRDIRAQRLIIDDNAGHTIKMQTASVGLSSYTLTWPLTAGTNNYALVTNGASGVLSWKSIESLSNSWGLNGNTLLGPEVLGSLNNFPLIMVTDSVERMRITTTGNIGIGNALPTQKLQVSGNILIDSARQLQFQNPAATGVTTFQAGAQVGDINYTLPLASPAGNGYILSSTSGGTMSWISPTSVYKYENGLILTNDTVRLGGPLTGATVIPFGANDLTLSSVGDAGDLIIGKFNTTGIVKNNASGVLSSGKINLNDTTEVTGTLAVTNGGTGNNTAGSAGQVIYFDGTKYEYTSTGTSGQVLQSNGALQPTWTSISSLVKANNGVSMSVDTVQLGGALTKNTSIPFGSNDLTLSSAGNTGNIIIGKFTTSGIVKNNASGVLSSGKINLNDTTEVTGTLSITNGGTGNNLPGSAGQVLYFDGTKYNYTSTGTSGQILISNGAGAPTWINPSTTLTYNNGLTVTGDTVQLGGTLLKNTSIPFGSNDLTLSSAGNTGNIIIGKFTTSGIVKNNASGVLSSGKINLNDTTEVTGTLSITNGGTGNNLPGSAGQVLYFDGTKYNYTSTGTSGQILISNGAGAPTWINPSTTLTYNNGLTVTGDTLQLGGALIKNTSIPFGSNDLTLSSAGNTGNIIIGKFTTSGIVKNNASGVLSSGKINLNDTTEVTGTLSITNGGTGNNLPGSAGQVLYFDGTKYNYTSTGTSGQILISNGAGAPTWINPSTTLTYNNGLTVTGDTLQLGGALIKNTSIPFGTNDLTLSSAGNTGNIIIGKFTTSGIVKNNASGVLSSGKINLNDTTEVTGTLSITNGGTGNNLPGSAGQVLYFDGTKYNYTSTGTSGQILISNGAGAPTWTNPSATLTYNNGLTVTGDTVQLGGTLLKNTSIPFGSNDLTLSSAGNTGNIIIGKFTSAGIVKNNASGVLSSGQVNLASASEVTGTLGITNGGTNNTTAGSAGQVIYFDGTKYDYTSTGTAGQVLQSNGALQPTWTSISSLVKANNGVSLSTDTVQLGGTLTKNTSIPFGSNDLTLSSAGNTGNIIIGKFTSAGIVKNNASGVLTSGQVDLSNASEVTGTLGITNGGTNNTTAGSAGQVVYYDGTKYNYSTTGTSGQLLQSNGAGQPTWVSVSNIVKANNGVSMSTDTVQLGGTLTKNTSIPFGSNDLTLSSAGNAGNIIIGKFTSAGIVKNNASGVLTSGQVDLSNASEVTGTLGITNGGTNNTTAGSAGQVVYYDGTKYNYSTTGTSGQLLQSNGAGQPTWVSVSNIVKANNGVSMSTDTVQLGGTLTKNTSIPFGSNDLTLSSAGNAGNIIIGKFTSAGIVKNNASGVLSSGQVNLASASEVTGTLGVSNGGTGNTSVGPAGTVAYSNGSIYTFNPAGSAGQILQLTGGVPTWTSVSAIVKANNGVSLSADTVQLGGTLTKATTIPFGSNDLTLSSAGNAGNIIIGKFTSAGIVKNSAAGVLSSGTINLASASEVSGTLGIANGGTNATTIGPAGTVAYSNGTGYTFSAAGTSGQLLTSGGAGAPTWTSVSTILNSLTADNGLTKSSSTNVQLGGALTANTTLTGAGFNLAFAKSGAGVVQLTNTNNTANRLEFYEPSTSGTNYSAFRAGAQAANFVYTLPTTAGTANQVLSISSIATDTVSLAWATPPSAPITAVNNGLTLSSTTAQLGGTLIQATSIDVGANNLTLGTGAAATGDIIFGNTNVASDIIVSKFSSAGIVKNSAAGVLSSGQINLASASEVTGTLGITNGGTNATTIGAAGTIAYSNGTSYTFSPAGTSGQLLTSGGAGAPTWTSVSTILNSLTADNGLTKSSATNVQLGGALTANTTLTQAGFNMIFQKTGTGNVQLTNTGTANQLQLFEPNGSGSNFSAFLSQAQTSDLKYVLPAVGGNTNQVLSVVSKSGAGLNDTTITLAWVTAGSSGTDWSLTGNASTNPATNFLGTTDAQDLELRVNGSPLSASSRRLRLFTTGGLQRFDGTTLPNSPGSGAVDLQSSRGSASQVASGTNSVIGGGSNNTSSNTNSTVAGGTTNTANAVASTVGGGTTNTANNQNSTVAGGSGNTASGIGSTISGGVSNFASNQNATVGGGTANNASGNTSTISGGTTNTASSQNATIGGGSGNTVNGSASTVAGGIGNTVNGANSAIPGGNGLTIGTSSFGFSGSSSSANAGSIGSNLAYFGDVNLIIGNIDNTARELRFYEANSSSTFGGANYTSFKAGNQGSDLIYTLPTTAPTAGQVLTSSGGTTSTLSWSSPSSAVTAANNGLLLSGTTVQLGGTLIRNTIDTLGNFTMDFFKTGTGNFRLTNNGTANQLQLLEPSGSGTNFSAFLSQAQTSDLKYVMPAVGGNANQVLSVISKSGAASNDTTLTLGWVNAGGSNWALLGNASTDSTINFLGTTDTRPLIFKTNNTERIKIHASGNVGVGTSGSSDAAVQMDINGGLATRPADQTIGSNTAVTVGNRSYIRLTNTTGTNWTITLSNGLREGQILIVQFNYTGAGMLLLNDAGNLNLSGNFQPAFTQSAITLIWDGGSWVETARSLN